MNLDPELLFPLFPGMVAELLGEDVEKLDQLRRTDFRRIFDALNAADTLSAVLRLHLHIEQVLSELLTKTLPFALDVDRWSMQQRLDLATALGLIHPHERASLLGAATLRNKLAHRLNYELTADDVANFIATMHPDLQRAFDVMRSVAGEAWGPDALARYGMFALLTTLMARMDFHAEIVAQGRSFRQAVDEAPPIDEADLRSTLEQVVVRVQAMGTAEEADHPQPPRQTSEE